jgi:hypothetical protein
MMDDWRRKMVGKKGIARIDITGQTYGRLTVLRRDFTPRKKHGTYWVCSCECGNEHVTTSGQLRDGAVRSCGCLARELARQRQQKDPDLVNLHCLYLSYQRAALDRGIAFDLTEDECGRLFSGACFYCGSPPSLVKAVHKNRMAPGREKGLVHNGIDRLNSRLGYSSDNVVSCCTFCNYAKRDRTVGEFTSWLDQLVVFRLSEKGAKPCQ